MDPFSAATSSLLIDGNKFVTAFQKVVRYIEQALLGHVREDLVDISVLHPEMQTNPVLVSTWIRSKTSQSSRHRTLSLDTDGSFDSMSIASSVDTMQQESTLPAIHSTSNLSRGMSRKNIRNESKESSNKQFPKNIKSDIGCQVVPSFSDILLRNNSRENSNYSDRPATADNAEYVKRTLPTSESFKNLAIIDNDVDDSSLSSKKVPMLDALCNGVNPWIERQRSPEKKIRWNTINNSNIRNHGMEGDNESISSLRSSISDFRPHTTGPGIKIRRGSGWRNEPRLETKLSTDSAYEV